MTSCCHQGVQATGMGNGPMGRSLTVGEHDGIGERRDTKRVDQCALPLVDPAPAGNDWRVLFEVQVKVDFVGNGRVRQIIDESDACRTRRGGKEHDRIGRGQGCDRSRVELRLDLLRFVVVLIVRRRARADLGGEAVGEGDFDKGESSLYVGEDYADGGGCAE